MTDRWPCRIAWCGVCLLLAAAVGWPLAAEEADLALAGDWRFDEPAGAGVRDASGFGNGGVLSGAERGPGRRGGALAFRQPGSVVRIPSGPGLNLAAAITVEAWIRPEGNGTESRIIVAKNDEYLLRVDRLSEGGRVSFFVHVGEPAVAWEPRVSSPAAPPAGQWTHVAAVWDGAALRLHLNGQEVASRPRPGKPNPNPYPVMIGNWEYPSCHGAEFGGWLDEVRVYGRALTADEVRAHAQAADAAAPAR